MTERGTGCPLPFPASCLVETPGVEPRSEDRPHIGSTCVSIAFVLQPLLGYRTGLGDVMLKPKWKAAYLFGGVRRLLSCLPDVRSDDRTMLPDG